MLPTSSHGRLILVQVLHHAIVRLRERQGHRGVQVTGASFSGVLLRAGDRDRRFLNLLQRLLLLLSIGDNLLLQDHQLLLLLRAAVPIELGKAVLRRSTPAAI